MIVLRRSIRVPVPDAASDAASGAASGTVLHADVVVPQGASGLVLFAHGSGSGRRSPRNRRVAAELNGGGLATVLADLLTREEERRDAATGELRFDINLLAARVAGLTDWLCANEPSARGGIGLFGASTGAAAALVAAAKRPEAVRTVVSRGGRPDLARDFLPLVDQPTLLVTGGLDTAVTELNRAALGRLAARDRRLETVPGATHLFEEPGTLEEVARLAREWFQHRMRPLQRR